MRNKTKIARNMLAAAVILLLPACLHACAASRKTNSAADGHDKLDNVQKRADSAEFVPLHPPVVVPHTWREAMNENR